MDYRNKLLAKAGWVADIAAKTPEREFSEVLQVCGANWEVQSIVEGPQVKTYHINRMQGEPFSPAKDKRIIGGLGEKLHQFGKIKQGVSDIADFSLEIPREDRQIVSLADIQPDNPQHAFNTTATIGLDASNNPVSINMEKAPHVLIAGTTGSGKSVTGHAIINSLCMNTDPRYLQFVLLDPTMSELAQYKDSPFTYRLGYTKQDALNILYGVCHNVPNREYSMMGVLEIMQGRFELLQRNGYASIYQVDAPIVREAMPILIVYIAEFAQLGCTAEIDEAVRKIGEIGRKTGVHLIMDTQNASRQVITATIKTNLATRIAMRVGEAIESRQIIGNGDAATLTGNGDAILSDSSGSRVRFQAAYISPEDIQDNIREWKKNATYKND